MKIKRKSLLGQSQRKPGASFQSPLPEESQGTLSIHPATNCNMVRDMLATREAHWRLRAQGVIGAGHSHRPLPGCTWTPKEERRGSA